MKIIFGNLKMNFLYRDFQNYLEIFRQKMYHESPKVTLGLAIPYIYLLESAKKIGSDVKVISQDLHPVDFGAFTSSISAAQIASLEIPATIVGHSECRALNQNSLVITNKVIAALKHGLEVIYCCGLDPDKEVSEELAFMKDEDWGKIIIAYEPISAIGSGSAMSPEEAESVLVRIKSLITSKWGAAAASAVRYLYGGSVNLDNYKTYLERESIDGVLVGGASLKVEDFWKMATLK